MPAATQLHETWGRRLRRMRRDRELTATAVAQEAGISRQYLHRIEDGTRVPSDQVRIAIAKAIGVSAADIFDYDDALESA